MIIIPIAFKFLVVIASEAKQSIFKILEKWIASVASSLAMTTKGRKIFRPYRNKIL